MAINNNTLAYALNQPTLFVPLPPIVSNRDPVGTDKYEIGQTWVNKTTNRYFVETSFAAGLAVWQIVTAGVGTIDQVTSNAGVVTPLAGNINAVGGGATNITTSGAAQTLTIAVISSPSFAGTTTVATGLIATTGNIVATAGNINATAGSMSAGTTITAGTGITATTGNITATTGDIIATAGAVSANTTVTAGTIVTAGTGITCSAFTAGVVQSDNSGVFSSTKGNNGEILIGSTAGVPAWSTITPGANISIVNAANSITISANSGAATLNYTSTATSPYVVTATDDFIGVDCSGGAIQVNLPDAPTTGRIFVIKDFTGSAATHNITVTTVGGVVTIDGATTYVMNTNFQSVQVLFDGTRYEIY